MFNAKDLLGQLLGGNTGAGSAYTGNASSGGGMLGGLGSLLSKPAVTGALSGAGGGLLAGLLLGNKKVRKVGGKVALAGGAVALGALAFKAFRNWQSNRSAQQQPASPNSIQWSSAHNASPELDFNCLTNEEQEMRSRAMLAAMVAAAKADGHFDQREQQLIREQLAKTDDAETTNWVQQEIRKPADPARVAAMASSPETASEIYLASLVVIDQQNASERAYLDALAQKLGLEPQLQRELERQLAEA
jgi:uncharacterized membrane protein YebE (DUF533 family)